MSTLRVYVAGASAEVDIVAEFIRRLRDTGVTITHDWTPSALANGGAADADLPTADRQRMLRDDLSGIASADRLWILVPEGVTIGAWAELGYAMGLGIPSFASGPHSRRSIFTELCSHFATHEEALRHFAKSAARLRAT